MTLLSDPSETDLADIRVAQEGEHIVLHVSGELCMATAGMLASAIDAAIDSGFRRVIVDVAEVRLLSAAAIGVLIARRDHVRLRNPLPNVERVLRITATEWLVRQ
jgi:anti-anti-sigma factor